MIHEKNFLYYLSQIRQKLFFYLEKQMAHHGIHDIAPSYGDILYVLDKKGVLTLQQLASLTMKDKSTVSSVVTRLERLGYIQKKINNDDKRLTLISITHKGKKYKPLLLELSRAMNKKCFYGISKDEKAMLFKILQKIYENADRL